MYYQVGETRLSPNERISPRSKTLLFARWGFPSRENLAAKGQPTSTQYSLSLSLTWLFTPSCLFSAPSLCSTSTTKGVGTEGRGGRPVALVRTWYRGREAIIGSQMHSRGVPINIIYEAGLKGAMKIVQQRRWSESSYREFYTAPAKLPGSFLDGCA